MEFDFDTIHPIRLKILLYLANHPQGKQKSEIANDLPISRNKSLKMQKDLFEEHFILSLDHFAKHRFVLSSEGWQYLDLLKTLEIHRKVIFHPDDPIDDEERIVMERAAKIITKLLLTTKKKGIRYTRKDTVKNRKI